MKKIFIAFVILLSFNSFAQFEDIFASDSDAAKFVSDYTRPAFKGLIYASNAAWVTSAKPIKPFHVEFNISAAGAFVSPEHETFTFNQADYQYLQIESGPNVLPTVMGEESQTIIKIIIPDNNNNQYKLLEFDAPDGIKNKLPVNAVPAPMAQLSMGLPLGSEVNLRYTPKLTSEEGGFFQILGLGFKHSLSQYFPKSNDENDKKRPFNLAVHASYQKISAGYDNPNNDKAVNLNISTIGVQGIASFDYKLISLYSAVGYTKGFSNLDVLGTYKYTYTIKDNSGTTIGTQTATVNDPLKLKFNMSGMKAKVGFKLKLAIFQIFADYTLQEYPVATAGFGLKF